MKRCILSIRGNKHLTDKSTRCSKEKQLYLFNYYHFEAKLYNFKPARPTKSYNWIIPNNTLKLLHNAIASLNLHVIYLILLLFPLLKRHCFFIPLKCFLRCVWIKISRVWKCILTTLCVCIFLLFHHINPKNCPKIMILAIIANNYLTLSSSRICFSCSLSLRGQKIQLKLPSTLFRLLLKCPESLVIIYS